MELSFRTIDALGGVVTGDAKMSPYRSGPQLVSFFNSHGGNALYGEGFPSRWKFAQDQIVALNGTKAISEIICDAFNPLGYLDSVFDYSDAISHFNKFLAYDGYKVTCDGMNCSLESINQQSLTVNDNFIKKLSIKKASHTYILEQSDKCKDKLSKGDFDGAITNARTMVEAVFIDVLKDCGEENVPHDGDLGKLYKRIREKLNLSSDDENMSQTLKQTLSGLSSIVSGLAGISNKMGDRHSRQYAPSRHHAVLAMNTAFALCEFIVSTLEYQKGFRDIA